MLQRKGLEGLVERKELLDAAGIEEALRRVAGSIVKANPDRDLLVVGIRTGGVFLAQRLCHLIGAQTGREPERGAVDITFYRDDVFEGLPRPEVGRTELPETLDGRNVVLVDDVLYTGRTVRAALGELVDFGRPRAVQLAVLVDRGHRELPIHADHVGLRVETRREESVRVLLRETGQADRVVLYEKKAGS